MVVHGPSPAEGAYVLIPPSTTPEEVANTLLLMNLNVRRRTYFTGMNRANKSRVVFKSEPLTVSPTGRNMPVLVRTTRFSECLAQPRPAEFSQCEGQSPLTMNQAYQDTSVTYQAISTTDQVYQGTDLTHQAYQATSTTNQADEITSSKRNDSMDGSLSLDSLAMMAPMLDQKSRSDFEHGFSQ